VTWSAAPTDLDWAATASALVSGADVLLLAHVSPDADALGSALAVGLALRTLGHQVAVSFGDQPFAVPRILRFLPGQELLVAPDVAAALRPSVVASFDVSSQDRLGVLSDTYDGATTRIAVDHHASYTGFGSVSVVDVTAPATAVLALELIDRLGVELTAEIATPLYAGLITDTGSFRFVQTTAQTHAIAGRLLATGIAHDVISRRIYDDEPFRALGLLGDALSRAELEPDAVHGLGLVHTWVDAAERTAVGLPLDALERIIDVLRTATEAEVAAVLKQDDVGSWRVSLRSKGAVDVSAVALGFGGGGHRYAAGWTSAGTLEQTQADLRLGLTRTALLVRA
jgi:phosphoesterase RecJ-like protein